MRMCLNYFGMVSLVYTLNWPLEKMTGILNSVHSVYDYADLIIIM